MQDGAVGGMLLRIQKHKIQDTDTPTCMTLRTVHRSCGVILFVNKHKSVLRLCSVVFSVRGQRSGCSEPQRNMCASARSWRSKKTRKEAEYGLSVPNRWESDGRKIVYTIIQPWNPMESLVSLA